MTALACAMCLQYADKFSGIRPFGDTVGCYVVIIFTAIQPPACYLLHCIRVLIISYNYNCIFHQEKIRPRRHQVFSSQYSVSSQFWPQMYVHFFWEFDELRTELRDWNWIRWYAHRYTKDSLHISFCWWLVELERKLLWWNNISKLPSHRYKASTFSWS